jgi:peptidoglycan/LPS O-acetylase OafA/YrhL
VLAIFNLILSWQFHQCERTIVMFVVAAPLIVALSALLYRYIEKPGITLGKALTLARV